ncbi:MAG: fluoride efflux transporter CrcB [Phascolarctobacterium sp.]|nr:fluoride efflux transporter CrcB [Phascolarctobacterium sp.]
MLTNCLAVGLGGALGAMSRYLLGLVILPLGAFPLGTFVINICGACLLGALNAWTTKESIGQGAVALFLKAGICGGFTTFSTYALEINTLLCKGEFFTAALYAGLSVFCGVLAAYAGSLIG